MDAVLLNVEVLSAALDVPVSSQVPPARPERMVCVSRDGGDIDELLDRPRITLMCWGRTDAEASALAVSAMHALSDAAQTHPLLSSSEAESMSRDEWTTSGAARYRVVLEQVINT